MVFAQFNELQTKVPLLYCILLLNSITLAYTHYGVAPDFLTIYITAFLTVLCIVRGVIWYRFRFKRFSLLQAKHQIRMTVTFAIIMSIGFSWWCYGLYQYGNFALQAHIVYYMSITVIGIIICLIHLPSAAWSISFVIGLPFVVFFMMSGQLVFVAIACNFTVIMAVIVQVTLSYYKAFSAVVDAKQELEYQHKQTQELNQKNAALANLDGLTNLANRRSFSNNLSEKLSLIQDKQSFIVGLIDLDGFKPVNDIYGHAAGDRVLADVSERLVRILDGKGFLARIGGDEFALISDYSGDNHEITVLGDKITKALRTPFLMRNGKVQISGSCGFAIYPHAGNTADELMERADFALYEVKSKARGTWVTFSSKHEQLIRKTSEIQLALAECVSNNELFLHYQPIVDVTSGKIVGLEALARWFHKELGEIKPDQFIPIAENTGAITQITISLFEKAIEQLKQWPERIFLSFNLSAHDITDQQTIEKLTEIINRHQISAHRIQFEITETMMMTDLDNCSRVTANMQKTGFKIAIDDFGSGYSSLSYIHRLAFNSLKIDRSFVVNLGHESRSQGIIKTIIALCEGFKVGCTVEGVETEEQKTLLLFLGCKYMQGYLFYRPGPIEDFDLQAN